MFAKAHNAGRPEPPTGDTKVSFLNLPNKGQLAILCLARLADPLAQTSIQSYMFYQLKFFDPALPDTAISTRAGILIGAKTAAQVCTGMLWGRFADSELGGRKVVLSIGLISCAVSYIGYGFSRTFATATMWQVLAGAMSSNVAITRCVVAELNPEKAYRVRALLLLPLFANAGNLLGPLIGGFLSSNRTEISEEQRYPYLGPNVLVAGVYLLSALGVILGLEETLESIARSDRRGFRRVFDAAKHYLGRGQSDQYTYNAVSQEGSPIDAPIQTPIRSRKLPFRRIWTVNVLCTMLSHFIITGHLGTFTSLWAIFISTPVGDAESRHPPFRFNGGLGMLPREVGLAMSLLGGIGVLLQTVVYPLLQDRLGTIRIWRTALLIFPVVYLLAPFPSLVASIPSLNTEGHTIWVWIVMIGVMALFTVGRAGVTPATTLLINDCTPHPSVRGTIHTAGTVIGNLSRSIFPVLALSIFGQGLRIGVVGLGFWCLTFLAGLAWMASLWVTEGSNGKEIMLDEEESIEDGEERVENVQAPNIRP